MELSVVVPIYNEAGSLRELHRRTNEALDRLGLEYEIILVDDGSRDGSNAILREFAQSARTVVVELNRNYGQHAAIFAGFSQARGSVIVTLDADLQNPPEEIGRLYATVKAGHDVVGSYRAGRQDCVLRRWSSRLSNKLTGAIHGAPIRDCGCMLRAYDAQIVRRMCRLASLSSFIPTLALSLASNPTEIEVEHCERRSGRSKYSVWRLLKLQIDILTNSTMIPLRLCSLVGLVIALLGITLSAVLVARRIVVGPEVEGVFTLFAILFFFIGLLFLAIGILGEYVGRIYAEVRSIPRYFIRQIHAGRNRTVEDVPEEFAADDEDTARLAPRVVRSQS